MKLSIPLLAGAAMTLALSACQILESEPTWDNPADSAGTAYAPLSSLSLSSSSTGDVLSSSSQGLSSSSAQETAAGCVLIAGNYVNQGCTYTVDQVVDGSAAIGPRARLRFVQGARLLVKRGALEISAGARLSFGAGSFVDVKDGGSIQALGESNIPVEFVADDLTAPWGLAGSSPSSAGLFLEASAGLSKLNYTKVSGAIVGLYASASGLVEINQSEFTGHSLYGLSLWEPQADYVIRYSAFSGNAKADIWARLPAAAALGTGLQLEKGIRFPAEELTQTLTLPGYAYIAEGGLEISSEAVLSISAGAHFYMEPGAYVLIADGRLLVNGSELSPVVFEPASSTAFWGDEAPSAENQTAIHFNQGCRAGSVLDHVRLLRARTALSSSCERAVEARNASILDYQYYGMASDGAGGIVLSGVSEVRSSVAGSRPEF